MDEGEGEDVDEERVGGSLKVLWLDEGREELSDDRPSCERSVELIAGGEESIDCCEGSCGGRFDGWIGLDEGEEEGEGVGGLIDESDEDKTVEVLA